jgi:tetratricopeptide (TPR) repeat protein
MIKKAKSLLFSGQKNKEDPKKVTKANEDTIEQFIEGDNLPSDEFSKKHEIEKCKDPLIEEMDSLINLYSEGKFSETLSLTNELLNQFPYSVDLHNIAGASNAALKNFDASINNYKHAIKINPDFADAHNNIGNAFLGKGDLDEAIASYKKATLVNPDYTEAYLNLGNAFMDKGMIDDAIVNYKESIETNPNLAITYHLIANALRIKGDLENAIANYKKATQIYPDYTEAYLNLGNLLMQQDMLDEAIDNYKKVIKINPDYAQAFNNLGNALQVKGDMEEAIDNYNQAIIINPDYAEAFNNLGSALRGISKLDDSINSYMRAIKLKPNYVDAYANMGEVLQASGRFKEAIKSCQQAIKIDPNCFGAYFNLGNSLVDMGQIKEALNCYNKAIKIKPIYPEAFLNMGNALRDLGELDSALKFFKHAIKLRPDYSDAHFNQSLVYLYKKNFKKGWSKYESRLERHEYTFDLEMSKKMRWKDSEKGRVLLWPEQGIGDELMFSSIIPELYKKTDKLLVQADERLIPLFKRSFSRDIEFYSSKKCIDENDYDYHIPYGSLPEYFRQTIESFENSSKGWLKASDHRTKDLRSKILIEDSQNLIGISWHSLANRRGFQKRSISLNQLATSLYSKNVRLISLQYGDFDNEIENLFTETGIQVIQVKDINNMNDIDDLAALISACDKVVSIDNATVHLAGALGKDTQVILPYSCDWRWGEALEKSYWYSSLKLYRQSQNNDLENLVSHL